MQFTLNTTIILIAGCLMLVACAGETHAQQDVPVQQGAVKEQSESLEQRCKQLSSETGKNYQVMSGEVLKVGVVPRSTADCFEPGCPELSKTNIFAIMRLLNPEKASAKLVVYTEKEEREALLKKDLYVKVEGRYSFCANEIEDASQYHDGMKVYNTISTTIKEEK